MKIYLNILIQAEQKSLCSNVTIAESAHSFVVSGGG